MKALVLEKYSNFVYKDVPVPEIGPKEVLIRVRACCVCGSDVHGMDGSTGRRIPPVIMGHEASGVIDKVGSAVTGIQEGDRVTFDSTVYCDKCEYCARGDINLCNNRRVLGVSCPEYRYDGAFAEFVAVPGRIVYKLPENVTFEQASMIEPLSVAFHAIGRTRISGGTAVVIGCGTIGLLTAQLLSARGFEKIIATDIMEEKLLQAKKLGIPYVINSLKGDLIEEVLRQTGGEGADLSLDAVGVDASVQDAIGVLRKGGESVLIGNLKPDVNIPLQKVVTKQLSIFGSCASAGEYPECLALIAEGKIDVDSLISKIVPLSEGNEWIHKVYSQEPGLSKIVVIP